MQSESLRCPFCHSEDVQFKSRANEWECQACEKRFARVDAAVAAKVAASPSATPSLDPAALPQPLQHLYESVRNRWLTCNGVELAWQVRDSMEGAIRFAAALAAAQLFHGDGHADAKAKLAACLLNPKGLSLGHWIDIIDLSLKHPVQNELFSLRQHFFDHKGRPTNLRRALAGEPLQQNALAGSGVAFVKWRNMVFGHGLFRDDVNSYARDAARWLPVLEALVSGLATAMRGWSIGYPSQGKFVVVDQALQFGADRHEPQGPAQAVYARSTETGTSVLLSPFLIIRSCRTCLEHHLFFFDKGERTGKRSEFLDYSRGHTLQQPFEKTFLPVEGALSDTYVWNRSSFDADEVTQEISSLLKDFDASYVPPQFLYEAIDRQFEETKYVLLLGPEGVGKSWLANGYASESSAPGQAALIYRIRRGELSDYRTFVSLLADQVRDRFRYRTQEIQTLEETVAGLRRQFAGFLSTLLEANPSLHRITVIVDGLDELDDPGSQPSILDFFPDAAELPADVHILFTSRPELPHWVTTHLQRLNRNTGRLVIDPANAEYEQVLRTYIAQEVPEHPAWVEPLVAKASGSFLHAALYASALKCGAFADVDALPEPSQSYGAFFRQLEARVGTELFIRVYRPMLLFLCAAREPVTLDTLVLWGCRRDHLQTTLFVLRDFVAEVRQIPFQSRWSDAENDYRYTLAHESVRSFISQHWQKPLQETESRIAQWILANTEREVPDGKVLSEQLTLFHHRYLLQHAISHLRRGHAGVTSDQFELLCLKAIDASKLANDRNLFGMSLDMLRAPLLYSAIASSTVPPEVRSMALVNQAHAFGGLGYRDSQDKAITAAYAVDPNGILAKANLANKLCRDGKWQEVLVVCDEVLATDIDDPAQAAEAVAQCLIAKANALFNLQEKDHAHEVAQRAYELAIAGEAARVRVLAATMLLLTAAETRAEAMQGIALHVTQVVCAASAYQLQLSTAAQFANAIFAYVKGVAFHAASTAVEPGFFTDMADCINAIRQKLSSLAIRDEDDATYQSFQLLTMEAWIAAASGNASLVSERASQCFGAAHALAKAHAAWVGFPGAANYWAAMIACFLVNRHREAAVKVLDLWIEECAEIAIALRNSSMSEDEGAYQSKVWREIVTVLRESARLLARRFPSERSEYVAHMRNGEQHPWIDLVDQYSRGDAS